MSKIEQLIKEKPASNPEFDREYKKENERFQIAVTLMKLREAEGLTQRQLAEKVGKPQSTIARIENGAMNVSYGILCDIANSLDKKLEVRFV